MNQTQESGNVILDCLAALAAASEGRGHDVMLMIHSYEQLGELRNLAAAAVGLAGEILNDASHVMGVPPDKILAAERNRICRLMREATP